MIHMKKVILPFLFILLSKVVFSQQPADGTYTYAIVFAEWNDRPTNITCTVVIKGDSIKVIHNGSGRLTGQKGEIIDSGIIMKHKNGKWIIGHDVKDKNTQQIGDCTGGPLVIDFKKKLLQLC